jgi:4-amino-4-deoxy-L-arabinose transferase-like glycosyltransferase
MSLRGIKNVPANYWIALFILLIIYLINLKFDLVIDSGKYAAISKAIFDTGDWIHLKILGEPYDQKPPFMFWLATMSFKLFGLSNASFKLPTLLITAFGTYGTYRLGKSLYGKKTGLLAAIMLIASQSMLLYNNDTHTDVILTMCILTGIWQLYQYISLGSKWSYFFGFVAVGLAVITKGPIGLVIPALCILSHVLVTRQYRFLSPLIWIPGILLVAIISTPALIGLYQQFGVYGLQFFFWTNNMGRIDGSYTGNHIDFLFCFHTVLYLFLPFSILLYYGLFSEIKQWIQRRFSFKGAHEGITLGMAIYLIILSLSKSQTPHYMLPAIPFIAIFTAKWAFRLIHGEKRKSNNFALIQNGILLLICVGSLLIPTLFFPTTKGSVWVPLLLMSSWLVFTLFRSKTITDKLVFVPVVAILMVNLVLSLHFFPEVFKYNATSIVSRDFNRLSSEKAKLYSMNVGDYETGFYAKNNPRFLYDLADNSWNKESDPWLYTDSTGMVATLNSYPKARIVERYDYRRVSKMNFRFLLPSSRAGELQKMYLIKVKE